MLYRIENIILCPLIAANIDLKKLLEWNLNYEVVKYMHARKKYLTIDDMKEFAEDKLNKVRWAIMYRQEFVGVIGLQDIDLYDRVADIAFIIGETDYYNKGIATGAGKIVMKHGFDILNLNKLTIGCFEINAGMRKVANKLGMELEGVLKEQVYLNNRYEDILKFGITRKQYYENNNMYIDTKSGGIV